MTVWAFLAVPLLIFPIVMLFRFLGCGIDNVATGTGPEEPAPPGYRATILAEPDLIAYWRLNDGTPDKKAKDAHGFQDGDYVVAPGAGLPPEAPNPGANFPGSQAAPGGFGFNPSQPGLILRDPATCREFNGGHVLVPYKPGLYTQEFTIEAWTRMEQFHIKGFQNVLFSAGGHYTAPLETSAAFHGFTLFVNVNGVWEMQIFTDGTASESQIAQGMVASLVTTHVAVTLRKFDPSTTIWNIYLNAKPMGSGTVSLYSPPDGAPLFIGVGGRTSDPNIPEPRFPMLSKIQEVALYKKALTPQQIQSHYKLNIS